MKQWNRGPFVELLDNKGETMESRYSPASCISIRTAVLSGIADHTWSVEELIALLK
jgi:hypothetical protein